MTLYYIVVRIYIYINNVDLCVVYAYNQIGEYQNKRIIRVC